MHFAQPLLGGLVLLAVPIILLMYLLKQKYKEKQVPSLYLCTGAMAEAAEKSADVLADRGGCPSCTCLVRPLSHGENTGAGLHHWFGLLFEYAGHRCGKKPF